MLQRIFTLLLLLFALAACNQDQETTPAAGTPAAGSGEVTLMTHNSFDVSEEVIAAFEAAHNARVVLLPAGDAGSALNQAILSKDNPLADVFFGIDNTFMGRALEADIFEPYQSPLLSAVPDALKLDESGRLLPVDYGDVCLNYDKAWFAEQGLEPPQTLRDLTDPAYQSLLVVENPATSSPGLAFLLATIAAFGTEGEYTYLDFWADLRANNVMVTDGWEDAYYGQFSVGGEGDRPLVVSYASSPPAEVIFAETPLDEAPTAAITAPGTCFRQIEFVGILSGTQNRPLAEALVDFILDEQFQADIPLRMFVFPANENVPLPEPFIQWAGIAQEPATLPPADIDANRETWLAAWRDVVLR